MVLIQFECNEGPKLSKKLADSRELQEVFTECLRKFEDGEMKHGPFCPETDSRNLLMEAEQEVIDVINYLAMHLIQTRKLTRLSFWGCLAAWLKGRRE